MDTNTNIDVDVEASGGLPAPRVVGPEQGWTWIVEGFHCFRRAPLVWMSMTAIFLVVSLLLTLVPTVSLLTLPLGVLLMGGMMIGCDALARGEPLKLSHLVAGFGTRTGSLVALGGLYLAAALLVMLIVGGLLWQSVAPAVVTVMSAPQGMMALSPGQLQALLGAVVVINLLWMLLMSPVLMAIWFAPALVVLDRVPALDAARLSLRGCLVNWRPFLVYSLVAMALLLVAIVPLGLGLLVAVPVLVASVYAGWRDIFGRASR